jgi:hypothetical protein
MKLTTDTQVSVDGVAQANGGRNVSLTLAVGNNSNASPFAGQPVTVSFDHFQVKADAIVCP